MRKKNKSMQEHARARHAPGMGCWGHETLREGHGWRQLVVAGPVMQVWGGKSFDVKPLHVHIIHVFNEYLSLKSLLTRDKPTYSTSSCFLCRNLHDNQNRWRKTMSFAIQLTEDSTTYSMTHLLISTRTDFFCGTFTAYSESQTLRHYATSDEIGQTWNQLGSVCSKAYSHTTVTTCISRMRGNFKLVHMLVCEDGMRSIMQNC